MNIPKKHTTRINDLLNAERVASVAMDKVSQKSSRESTRVWVRMGWENSQALYREYGLQSFVGSLYYWNRMKELFMDDTPSPN